MATKQVRTPGDAAPAAAFDDLAQYDAEELPKADPAMVEIAALRSEVASLRRASQSQAAPSKPREPVLDANTQAEAAKMCAEMLAQGRRPRALLTPDGWYTHPEMARVPGSLGNVAPGSALAQ